MNYAGKFDATLGAKPVYFHVDSAHIHAPTDAIVVPDAQFLFHADFKRSGVDLILSKDGHDLTLRDYFKGEHPVAIASPDGAHLTGTIVSALAGAHVQVSQAGGATSAAGTAIGHVTKLAGNCTVVRNGVSIILNMGDNVEKGDVAQTGDHSTLGITFIDGSVFGLSSNARMVLNEMVYDPNGSNNSSLLSLVAGTIVFVAGETAKHGDMKVDTPVATMGIRGTAVLAQVGFDANNQPQGSFQVLVEGDGTVGKYVLYDKITLQPLATVAEANVQTNISAAGISTSSSPLTPEQMELITETYKQKYADTSNTKLTSNFTDSITQQLSGLTFLTGFTTTLPVIPTVTSGSGSGLSSPQSPPTFLNPFMPPPPSNEIWNETKSSPDGSWFTASNWITGVVPTATQTGTDDAVIKSDPSSGLNPIFPVTIGAGNNAVAHSVTMDNLGGTAPELDNFGTLTIGTALILNADSILHNSGTITAGEIELRDNGSTPNKSVVLNSGTINLTNGGDLDGQASVTNTSTGIIDVQGGTLIVLVDISNAGNIIAEKGATIVLASDPNNPPGTAGGITGGTVTIDGVLDQEGTSFLADGTLANNGVVNISGTGNFWDDEDVTANANLHILAGAALTIDLGSTVANALTTIDGGATLTLNGTTVTGGTVTDNGTIHVTGDSAIDGAGLNGGQVTVDATTTLTLDNTTVTGTAITDNGTVKVDASKTLNFSGVTLTGGAISNLGTLDIIGDSAIVSDALSNTQLTVDAGKTLTLNGTTVTGGTVTDNGTILVTGNAAATANFNGTGAIDIFNNVQFEINGSVVSTDTVFFEGNQGELTLDQAKLFSGLITGTSLGTLLTPNDQIDLRDLKFVDLAHMSATFVSYKGGVSTFKFSNGSIDIFLEFSGNYTDETWQFANDGNGGTLIELANIDHWINSNGGDWNVATNWSEGVPGLTNVALDAPGTYTVTSTTNVDINSMIVDAGVSLLTDPGTLFRVEGNVINDGTIDAGPFSQNFISTIDIEGNVSGTGLFVISDKAVLEFGRSVSTGETVEFIAGHGELILDDSAEFHGVIESSAQGTPLSTNNLIDLRDLAFVPGQMSAKVVGYNPTTNITSVAFSNGLETITLQFFGKVGNWTLISDGHGPVPGTIVFDPPLSGGTTIASGATLDITSASAQSVTFTNNNGNTGELILDDSKDFTGEIIGFAGNGTTANSDLIDLTDVNFADVAASKTTYTNNGNGTGTLTLYNAAGGVLAQITFVGNYQLSNFVVETDSNGHTLIVDPPAGNQHQGASGDSGSVSGGGHTDAAPNPFTLDLSGSTTLQSIQQHIAAHDTFVNNDSGPSSGQFVLTPSLPAMDLLHNSPDTFHLVQGLAVTSAAGSSGSVAPANEPLHLPNGGAGSPFTVVANPDQFVFSESPVRTANNLVADLIQGQNLVSPANSADHWNFAPDTAANGSPQHVELGVDMTQLNHDTFVKSAAIGAQHVSDFHLVI